MKKSILRQAPDGEPFDQLKGVGPSPVRRTVGVSNCAVDLQQRAVALVAVDVPVDGPFDYFVPEEMRAVLVVGDRVQVVFSHRTVVGIVVGFIAQSRYAKLSTIVARLDTAPIFDAQQLALTQKVSDHFGCAFGEVLLSSLPPYARQTKALAVPAEPRVSAMSAVDADSRVTVVHDPARRQCWPFLSEEIKRARSAGGGVLILAADSARVAAVVSRLALLGERDITVVDRSELTPKKEMAQWLAIKSGECRIIIGTRSAVFAPIVNLALIVVFDEDAYGFYQEQPPHYHAAVVARLRADLLSCRLLFVSSAPSVELWDEAARNNWRHVHYDAVALGEMQRIDMTNYNQQKMSVISFALQARISQALEKKEQIILLINRRGFSMATRCTQCGFTIRCPRCDVALTQQYVRKKLVCRYCNFSSDIPTVCPQCASSYLRSLGMGTEKLESEIARLYPQAVVARYDKETEAFPTTGDIIIATQALVSLQDRVCSGIIAIIDFDAELYRHDFRSSQRAFSLVITLRAMCRMLYVQTRMPDTQCLVAAQKGAYAAFYEQELTQRQDAGLPPYQHMVSVQIRGMNESTVVAAATALFGQIHAVTPRGVTVLEPYPDVVAKLRDKYRYTVMFKGKELSRVRAFAKKMVADFKRKRDLIVTLTVDQ